MLAAPGSGQETSNLRAGVEDNLAPGGESLAKHGAPQEAAQEEREWQAKAAPTTSGTKTR